MIKTHAGDIHIEFSGDWDDESNYVYRRRKPEVEVRIEHSPVGAAATPDSLLDIAEERMKLAAPVVQSNRANAQVSGKEARTLMVVAKGKKDKEASLMRVLVFKPEDQRAVTVTVMGTAKDQDAVETAWRELLAKIKVVAV